jgi:hypothetical protein
MNELNRSVARQPLFRKEIEAALGGELRPRGDSSSVHELAMGIPRSVLGSWLLARGRPGAGGWRVSSVEA